MAKKTSQKVSKKLSKASSGKSSKPQKKNKSKIKNADKLAVDKQVIPRDKEKYPALNFKRQVKLRRDYFEGIEEYVDKLSPKEKEWLNRFVEETIITNFKHKGQLLYKDKLKHREFYNANNARNRCMFTKAKAMNTLINVESLSALEAVVGIENSNNTDSYSTEDGLIEMITLKNSGLIEQTLINGDKEVAEQKLQEQGSLKSTKLLKSVNDSKNSSKPKR